MRNQQRPELDPSWFEPTDEPWEPAARRDDGIRFDLSPRPTDRYVVVDEIVEGRARLVAAPWPVLDRGKRLRFGSGRRNRYVVPLRKLEDVVDAHRSRSNQVQRPIRIGDAFLVRGKSGEPAKWESVIDITEAARRAARVAFLSAVAPPTPDQPRLPTEMLRTETAAPEPLVPGALRPGSVAHPVV